MRYGMHNPDGGHLLSMIAIVAMVAASGCSIQAGAPDSKSIDPAVSIGHHSADLYVSSTNSALLINGVAIAE